MVLLMAWDGNSRLCWTVSLCECVCESGKMHTAFAVLELAARPPLPASFQIHLRPQYPMSVYTSLPKHTTFQQSVWKPRVFTTEQTHLLHLALAFVSLLI